MKREGYGGVAIAIAISMGSSTAYAADAPSPTPPPTILLDQARIATLANMLEELKYKEAAPIIGQLNAWLAQDQARAKAAPPNPPDTPQKDPDQ